MSFSFSFRVTKNTFKQTFCVVATAPMLIGLAISGQEFGDFCHYRNVRYRDKADMPVAVHMSAFGGKADMTVCGKSAFAVANGGKADMGFCTANVRL